MSDTDVDTDHDQMLVLNRKPTAAASYSSSATPTAAATRPPFRAAPSTAAAMSSPAGVAAIAAATGGVIDSGYPPPHPTSTLSLARTASTPARGGPVLSFREPPGSLSMLAKTEAAAAAAVSAAAAQAASNLPPAAVPAAAATAVPAANSAAPPQALPAASASLDPSRAPVPALSAQSSTAPPPAHSASASFDPSRLVLHTPTPRNPQLLRGGGGMSRDPTIAAADRALSLASPSYARAAQAQAQQQAQQQAQAQRTSSLASSTLNNRTSASGNDSSFEPSLSEQRRSSTSANDSGVGPMANANQGLQPQQRPQQQQQSQHSAMPAMRPNTLPPLAFQPPQPALASGAAFPPMLMPSVPPQQQQPGQLQPQQSLGALPGTAGVFPRPMFQPMMVMMYPPPPGAFGGYPAVPPQPMPTMAPQQSMTPQQPMQMQQPQQPQPMMHQATSQQQQLPQQSPPRSQQQQQQQHQLSPPARQDLQRQSSDPATPNPALLSLRPRSLITGDSSLASGSPVGGGGGGGGAGGGGGSPPKFSPSGSGSRPNTPPRTPHTTKVLDLSSLPSLRSKPTLTEMELSRARRLERDRTMFLLWILAALVMLTLCFHIHRFSFDKTFYARFASASLAIAIVAALILLWPIGMIFLGRSVHETTPSTVLVHSFLGWLTAFLLYVPLLVQEAPGAAAIETHRAYSMATLGRAVEFSANSSGAIAAALALHLVSLTAFYILLLQIVTGEHRGAEGGMTLRERTEFHASLAAVQDFDRERGEWMEDREKLQRKIDAQARASIEANVAHKRVVADCEQRLTEALQAKDQLTSILDGLEVSKATDGRASLLASETIGHIRKNHEFEVRRLLDEAQARQRMTLAMSKELDLAKEALQAERTRAQALQTESDIIRLQLSNAGLEQSRLIDLQSKHDALVKEYARTFEAKSRAEALVLLAEKGSCVSCSQWSERLEEQRKIVAAQGRVIEENETLKAALLTAQKQLATAARRDLARDSRTRRKVDKIQRDLHEFDLFTQEHEPAVPDEEFEIRYSNQQHTSSKKTA